MGKRKYDNESSEVTKKNRSDSHSEGNDNMDVDAEQPQNEEDSEIETTKSSKSQLFDVKHFRKELVGKQGQTMALTQFLQVCLNPDCDVDYMFKYLKAGGNSHEILRQITQDNKKNLTLATPAFHLFHLIILKVQSSLPHMIAITEEACRYFLNTFIPTIEIMVSENSGPRHRKIVLNLLTSMVTLNSELGVEILNQVPLTPKNLQHVVEKPNYKEKDNVRTAFVHFMTSFLVDGHLPLIKALLEKQGLLSLVIPGLVQDEADAVLMFLNILKKNVIDNTFISKTLKLKTFSHQVLHNLFRLFTWKGPPESSNENKDESRNEIMTLLSDIILTLFTSHKLGIYFIDPTLGTSDANKNQNLYKAMQSLKRPWENEFQSEAVLQIVYKCPDLHRALINVIEPSFQPQHSLIWERTTDFILKLLDKLKPEEMVTRLNNLNPHQTANFVRFVTMPVPLLKLINTGIGKDQTISFYCIKVLVKMLQTLKRYMQIIELDDSNVKILELKNKLENFLPKHMPAPNLIVSLINDIIDDKVSEETPQDYKLPAQNKADSLLSLLELLLLYNYLYPASIETIEGTINMKKILDISTTLSSGHISLLKFKIVSLWLALDSSVLTLQNSMFKDLFLIMLDIFTNDEDDTWVEAKDTLYMFFKNTEIFEADEDEIHLILYTLKNSEVNPISLIGDVIENVLKNRNELSEYIKNQMVNFEISDENSMTNLDKLFNDLMHGKMIEDSFFLENKMPSTFIVGCIQYIQNNKDAKNQLKSFLCLYIANLLHSNYSPQLTEVLMSDSKLDIRTYIAEWTVRPVCFPENKSNDVTLINISKSVIGNEDIPLTNIFPSLVESSDEIDLSIMGVNYKIDVTKQINSSDLYIWSKYLMFCIVRLTNMDNLTREQQKKILNYFEIIISLGKRHLMLNICRSIVMNMFKNAHFLKIFQPIDLNKQSSNILATELLVNIIEKNRDIINYLNRKHFLLKSYQQKTYSEIVKCFIKIKKRKTVNSDLTIRVLETVGLSKDDDLKVFESIFSADTEVCYKEDKEPSLVLELLCVLINKYSDSISLELSNDVLTKCMDLYGKLLSLKEIIPNLTSIEESLVKYFENKPHQAQSVNEEHFKKFFYANAIRKTTSLLAYTILKFNNKFCDIFKEEMNRAEIRSQREITLPLGNAIIDHNQYLSDNKEILTMIYNEYKTNINKFLEKPHKAGQVYLNSWKFIRKLLIECTELNDCQKLFSKCHKFEIVELSHVHLMQTVFLKLCLSKDGHKKEYLINYLLSMLNTTTLAVKDNKDANVLSDLVSSVSDVIQICKTNENFQVDQKEEFKKLIESVIWQNFCKAVLKDSLKIRTAVQENITGPKLLSLLSSLVKLFYPSDHEDIVTLFDMVTSHSEFLNVMLSNYSPDIKSRLLEFLHVLISTNKSVMKTPQIPVYLSAYRATRSPSDRLILTILKFYESNDLPVNEYKPYLWGDSAANHYAIRKNRTSTLWSHPTPNQVINLLDKDIIEKTVRLFPVKQKLEYNYELPSQNSYKNSLMKRYLDGALRDVKSKSNAKDTEEAIKNLLLKDDYRKILAEAQTDVVSISHEENNEGIYDPCFLFPLLSHLLAPGSVASCFKLLRTGLLSVPVMGLSSHCPLMRAAAYHVLHRFCLLLETETRHKNDKLLLMDFITTLRQSLSTAIKDAAAEGELKDIKNPKLPATGASYLAKALLVVTSPSEPLYKPVNNFLIAKQFVDLTIVPDFLSLFHDSNVEAMDRRNWILDVIRDGTKSMTDVNVVFKTMCLKMIFDFYNTVMADRKTKVKILGALNSIVSIPRSFEILVEGYGFMSWLHYVVRNVKKEDKTIVKETFALIGNMIHSLGINIFVKYCAKFGVNGSVEGLYDFKIKSDVEYEILSIVYDLLPHTDLLEFDDVVSYIKLYNSITKRSIKFLTKKQITNIVTKCCERCKKSESVKLINQAILMNNPILLSSKILTNSITPESNLINELVQLVHTYVVS
ncbi:nucleolar pre-ribosomal-associated protein 1 [Vanessa atalanta]|uniref:nucleolar pre-ribosomal-associated protein 1 n=1 Tax=Vanessa atalanta TaxID=42275 RepID=UPI001FCDB217|nr:nucleolar pre-ribosomal-associated protein 1 [Vanessa atalanta]